VQIVENWADIKGEVMNSDPSKAAGDFIPVEVKVNDIKDVKDHRNLLADKVGEVIEVNVPKSLWESLDVKKGETAVMRVRMASSRKLFAHPEHLRTE
jgi:hypothetical protein